METDWEVVENDDDVLASAAVWSEPNSDVEGGDEEPKHEAPPIEQHSTPTLQREDLVDLPVVEHPSESPDLSSDGDISRYDGAFSG